MRGGVVSCPPDLEETVRWMLDELQDRKLEVGLVSAPEEKHTGHCVRLVETTNPDWYRQLCRMYPRSRQRNRKEKFTDPNFCRSHIKGVLSRLLNGGSSSQYAEVLVGMAREEREEWEDRLRSWGRN